MCRSPSLKPSRSRGVIAALLGKVLGGRTGVNIFLLDGRENFLYLSSMAIKEEVQDSLTIQLPKALKRKLRRRAMEGHRNLSEWCRMKLEEALRQEKK